MGGGEGVVDGDRGRDVELVGDRTMECREGVREAGGSDMRERVTDGVREAGGSDMRGRVTDGVREGGGSDMRERVTDGGGRE